MNLIKELKRIPEDHDRYTIAKHIGFFLLTFISVTVTGMGMTNVPFNERLLDGLAFSIPLMIIIAGHEFGHYLQARKYNVDVSLPLFIPLPLLSPFGTMGAFIRMRQKPENRKILFDIAWWGPFISFILSVPASIAGILLSKVQMIPVQSVGMKFGEPLIMKWIAPFLINVPDGADIMIHPIGFAAWVGFLLTAINLLPVGQLDGGHLLKAVVGPQLKKLIERIFLGFMIILMLDYSGWILLVLILIFLIRRESRFPQVYLDPPLMKTDRKRLLQALAAAIMMILCFMPKPMEIENPGPQIQQPPVDNSDDSDEYRVNFKDSHGGKNFINPGLQMRYLTYSSENKLISLPVSASQNPRPALMIPECAEKICKNRNRVEYTMLFFQTIKKLKINNRSEHYVHIKSFSSDVYIQPQIFHPSKNLIYK